MPAAVTMIDEVVAPPMLQSKVPVAEVYNKEVMLQLSISFTTGAAGVAPGAAMPVPTALIHPLTVRVTL